MRRSTAFLALFLTLIVLASIIVSLIFPWYYVRRADINNSDNKYTTLYYWNEVRVTNDNINVTDIIDTSSGVGSDAKSYDDMDYNNVKQVFTVSLVFLCVAGLLCLLCIVVTFISFVARNSVCAKVGGVFMLLTMATLLVAFFQFFRITRAFRSDDPQCFDEDTIAGKISSLFQGDDTYCHKLMGKSEGNLIIMTYLPYVGFWVVLVGIVFSILAMIPLFKRSKHH